MSPETLPQLYPLPKLWSRAEYQRMGDLGVFPPGERVELIEGAIFYISPQNVAHTRSVSRGTSLLVPLFAATHYVRVQCSLWLNERSEPEPDFALVEHALVDGPEALDNPTWADLVIEVSDSSLAFDRGAKRKLYASAGLPEYWIVNLPQRQLEVHRQPHGGDYRERQVLGLEQAISPLFAPSISVPVAGLF